MALIAAHLNAGIILGVTSVALRIVSPPPTPPRPPSPPNHHHHLLGPRFSPGPLGDEWWLNQSDVTAVAAGRPLGTTDEWW